MIVKKLEILKEAQVIDEQTEAFVLKVNEYFISAEEKVESANLEMFLTHLAMATMRQKGVEPVHAMNETIRLEIANHPKIEVAKKIWLELESYGTSPFTSNERWFIYMHLINLLNSEM